MTLLSQPGLSSGGSGTSSAAAPDQAQQLRDLVRQGVSPGGSSRSHPQPQASAATAAPQQPVMRTVRQSAKRAKVIAVTSGKGGVGKTNLAVNLAVRFAQAGKKTILLDADLGLANADVLCNLDLKQNLAHVIARRTRLADVLVDAPGGFKLVGGASGLARMADLPEAEHRRVVEALIALERNSDLILIDTGAGISQNVLSFTRCADQVLVVTTPEPTAITDAYATIKVIVREDQRHAKLARQMQQVTGQAPPPAIGSERRPISLLVNNVRSPQEATEVYQRVSGVARQFLNVDVLDAGHVVFDRNVALAVQKRTPFVLAHPRSPASVCVTRLAMRMESGVSGADGGRDGFFSRIGRAFRRDA